jgi:hypothetical protein
LKLPNSHHQKETPFILSETAQTFAYFFGEKPTILSINYYLSFPTPATRKVGSNVGVRRGLLPLFRYLFSYFGRIMHVLISFYSIFFSLDEEIFNFETISFHQPGGPPPKVYLLQHFNKLS